MFSDDTKKLQQTTIFFALTVCFYGLSSSIARGAIDATTVGCTRSRKAAAYEFLKNPRYNWRKFLLSLVTVVVRFMDVLTSEQREKVLIIDDSLYDRSRSKVVELLAWVHDHNAGRSLKGFKLLTLGWSDGVSFLPLDFTLCSSAKAGKRLQGVTKEVDKRCCGYKRRMEAMTKSTRHLETMVKRVQARVLGLFFKELPTNSAEEAKIQLKFQFIDRVSANFIEGFSLTQKQFATLRSSRELLACFNLENTILEKPTVVMTFDNSSTFGGSINSLYYLAKTMDRSTLDLIIVSGQAPEYLHDRFKNLTCYHFKSKMPWIDNKMYSKFKKKKYFDYIKILMKCILVLRSVYWFVLFQLPESVMYVRLIRKHNVQVLHFNSGVTIPLIIASKLLKIPCINHLRGFVAQDDSIVRFFFQCADHHVAISTSIRDNLLKLGVPPSRISLVNDAVDLEEFNQDINVDDLKKKFGVSSQNLTYGIFGRVIPWKGIREFIFAAKEVNKRIPGAIGFIVGDHSDGDSSFFVEMQTLSTELGLEGKLIFAGFRPNVIEMMALMDIVVHASIEPEPFGMVIIEGMAMGKPVIATRGGGPLDIIEDGQSGILVQLGNPVALADAIISLLINSNLRNLMGQKGRCRVEEFFSSTLYAKKMGEIFQRFISY